MRERRGPVIAGVVLILIGILFLARELLPELAIGSIWPIASVILGVVLVIFSFRPARPDA